MIKIAVDLMGGDDAPQVVLDGIELFLKTFNDVEIQGYGLPEYNTIKHDNFKFIACSEQITMDDEPVRSVRRKKDASMVRAAEAVKLKTADACVSAGNTGALMSAGLFIVGRIKGIERPALAMTMPTIDNKGFMLLDMGANADAKPEHLVQYAKMANIYAKANRKIANPTIGLANIGTEDKKGNTLTKETFALLKAETSINFIGNVEPKTLLNSTADIVVTDGFTGNIILKTLEGTANNIFKMLKQTLTSSTKNKLATAIIKNDLAKLKGKMDYSEYGGAVLFGVNGLVIKAHGSSDKVAIYNALRQARLAVQEDVVSTLTKEVGTDE
ncbi:phosphate acyltransferase PlsX [Macrococcus epidermidis]|mgnify:CR=1 FL=1|uniref:Phosphate acyltransferase n=1 Tax=Macrococcus epidermidis TaxID=1902580 RepID=A0A327ZVQ3_9STAP|nr:phosphate acyltransferase PlsX [Macrococcus epidermidis]RAK46490.1 phosphate acyltransferase PlsX [Macrococcus epidermidis]UTH17290.1 phosphate acyltransferase PlsX [Macrococcus epidermidis]